MKKGRNHIEDLMERYLAGNLNNEETRELFSLLGEEPDLFDGLLEGMPVISGTSEDKFPFRSRLLKSYSDLSEEQFEYLCIASAEGDLTPEQQEELEAAVKADEKRSATYNIYKRLRLPAEAVAYPGKERLRKTTPFARITRVASVVMAAAASVAILIIALNYTGSDTDTIPSSDVTASVTEPETHREREAEVSETMAILPVLASVPAQKPSKVAAAMPEEEEAVPEQVPERSIIMPVAGQPAVIRIAGNLSTPGLADIYTSEPAMFSGPLSLRDYLAIAFRERILGEEIPDRSPVRAYEVASAGVNGLNRLLGWEMDIEFVKEKKGEPEAVIFSSRLVKFQTPVKKNASEQ